MAVTNVGVRPTVSGSDRVSVESYILDFEGDLYDHTVRVEFHHFIRDERKFSGVDELKAQIPVSYTHLDVYKRQLYESARLDGAGFWTQTWNITIPSIRPVIAPAAVMTTFITFKQFDIIYLLTQQRGYMTGATLNTVITYVHQNAFASNNYGLSSAVSMLLFVIIILFSFATNRSLRED